MVLFFASVWLASYLGRHIYPGDHACVCEFLSTRICCFPEIGSESAHLIRAGHDDDPQTGETEPRGH